MPTKTSSVLWKILPVLFTGGLNLFAYAFLSEWVESPAVVWVVVIALLLGLGSGQLCEKIGNYNDPRFSVYLPAAACVVFLLIQLLSQ